MDWNSIIIALISALTGGGLTALLTLPQARKKAEGEADSAALQPLKEANEIIREQLKEANEREQEMEDRKRAITAEKDALYERLISIREESAVIKQYICVHGGCQLRQGPRAEILRRPPRGLRDDDRQPARERPAQGVRRT